MTETLEEITEQEIPKLSRRETILNFARHLPLFYIPASVIAKPIIKGQNPVDYWTQDPAEMVMAVAGLTIAGIGAFLKQTNDESEMKTICANLQSDNPSMVETGAYRHTRHPCYSAQTLIATGFAVLSPAIDTGIALATYLGLTQNCAKAEERKNLAQFGDRYKEYMGKVPRWPVISKIPEWLASTTKYFSRKEAQP